VEQTTYCRLERHANFFALRLSFVSVRYEVNQLKNENEKLQAQVADLNKSVGK
jgi:cell division protein FtsB